MIKKMGILTAGSDCPGLNAAIRAIGKAALGRGLEIVGFQDGFYGLINDQTVEIGGAALSGILMAGGTILGTSRAVPQDSPEASERAIATYQRHRLDALVCIGGRETQAAALHLTSRGMNLITVPKAIDNDIAHTERTIGFDSAREVGAEAIDRLHSTAHSNHRIIIVELMGRSTGWLPLGAGIAGGADVILIPEIPYDLTRVAEAITQRHQAGKSFSIVAVGEQIQSREQVAFNERLRQMNARLRPADEQAKVVSQLERLEDRRSDSTYHLAARLEELTDLETRITIMGYLLRGGSPTAADRILATELGAAAVACAAAAQFGVMVAAQAGRIQPVALTEVVNGHKPVPHDHHWIDDARRVGVSLGD
jgi:6-phosphofructokinase 1